MATTSLSYLAPDFKRRFRATGGFVPMRRFPARVLLSTGGSMFIVTIDLDQYDRLPPRQLKAMLRALRFADPEGVVHASLSMLAMPGLSRSTAHRELAGLEEEGHVSRQERPEGGFLWRIGQRLRCRHQHTGGRRQTDNVSLPDRPSSWDETAKDGRPSPAFPLSGTMFPQETWFLDPPDGTPVLSAETPVPQRGTTDSRATPAVKNLSSGSKEPSERELSLSQDEIPDGWEEAVAAERRLAGLGEVNLRAEWRKLVAYSEGARITIWRWRGWVLKARCDGTAAKNDGHPSVSETTAPMAEVSTTPGDDRQQRQARDWVRRGFWLRDGSWGPAPDQPGCSLPADLVAWCLRERQVLAA